MHGTMNLKFSALWLHKLTGEYTNVWQQNAVDGIATEGK
jgi:hypothetical protein